MMKSMEARVRRLARLRAPAPLTVSARAPRGWKNQATVRVGMKQTVSLGARFGWLGAQATYVHAALLAAHVAAPRGFRPSEVRFYFLLFTNWMEADVMRPGQDLDLTQIRRALTRLQALGHAERAASAEGKRPSFRLTRDGMRALATAVVEPPGHRPFEEMLFSIAFAAAYAELLETRLRASGRGPVAAPLSPLDARKALKAAQRGLDALSRDLEERVRSSLAIEASSRSAPGELDMSSLFAEHGGYQLERVKPLKELLAGLPSDVRAFEEARGIRLRRELLFAPMAQAIRGQQAILEDLARSLR
jgi:hypothetical protein